MAASAAALAVNVSHQPAAAKIPGEVHCYGGVCHRVRTVAEVKRLIGKTEETVTSFYDVPGRDRFNTGTITSSGERFNAESRRRVSSSVYPDGTELLLWNPRNGRAAHVRVNDFGPFYRARTLDVTRRVAEDLDFHKSGVTTLRVIVIAAPSDSEARYRRNRQYSETGGFLGTMSEEDISSLAGRLIADARQREATITVAQQQTPEASPATQPLATASAGPNTPVTPPAGTASPSSPTPWIVLDSGPPAPKPLAATTAALMAHAVEAVRRQTAELPTQSAAEPRTALVTQPAATPPPVDAAPAPTAVAALEANARFETAPEIKAAPPEVADVARVEPPAPTVVARAEDGEASGIRTVLASGSRLLVEATGMVAMMIDWRTPHEHRGPGGSFWSAPASWRILAGIAALSLLWWARLGMVRTVGARRARRASASDEAYSRAADIHGAAGQPAIATLQARAGGPSHAEPRAGDLAAALTAMADRHSAAGRFVAAERRYRMALHVRERQPASGPLDVLADLHNLAAHLQRRFRHADGDRMLHRLVMLTEARAGGHAAELATPLRQWADSARDHGRLTEAAEAYARALQIAERNERNAPGAVADVLDERALLYIKKGRVDAALADAKRALTLRWRMLPPDESSLAVSLSILAEARRQNGELLAAETAHREALSRFIRATGPDGLQAAGSMTSLAEVLCERGMTAEARQLLEAAIPVLEAHLGLRHPGLANVHNVLASVHLADGEIDTAVRLRRKSLDIIEHVLGHEHQECVAARGHLAELIDERRGTVPEAAAA